ncbi:hypothetical protein AGR9A_Cc80306 [Agrobacterium salinitolerans str. Hayward 0363]|nr:hypothetical protein AGR9A_Cc80306 [Agrobacterium salinitolerans str. Hayward 0363]
MFSSQKECRQSYRRPRIYDRADHNAVQHEFLLHLLLFISRSSGTLRSMICPRPFDAAALEKSAAVAWPSSLPNHWPLLLPCLPGSFGAPLICQGTRYVAKNGFRPSAVFVCRRRRPCR